MDRKLPLRRKSYIKCDYVKCSCRPENDDSTFMSFDEKRKIFWYEIPRNASTTVKNILKDGLCEYREKDCDPNFGQLWAKNKSLNQFAIIRNPFDRVLSAYSIYKNNVTWDRCESIFGIPHRSESHSPNSNTLTLENFISLLGTRNDHHFQPQTIFLPDDLSDITLIELSNFDNEWTQFFDEIGECVPKLRTFGTYVGKNPPDIFRQNDITKIILDFYKDDFDRLGFSTIPLC